MEFEEIMSYASLAFYTADFEKAIEHANEAGKKEPKNPEVFELLAKAYQALEKSDEAIKYFLKAIDCDVTNGDRYVELGIAYGTNDMPIKALEAFAKAEELGCTDDYKGSLYRMLAMVDYDLGRYDDAVANFTKAQEWLEPDMELLMYKALSSSMAGNLSQAISTVNQIKQIAPTSYNGYNLAYTFFMHLDKLDDAEKELKKAEKWVSPLPMDYYFDSSDLQQAKFKFDEDRNHLLDAILLIDKGIREAKPNVNEVVNAYLEVADICIQVERFEAGIALIQAAENPVYSFNKGFSVIPWVEEPELEKPLSDVHFDNPHYQSYDTATLNELAEQAAAKADNQNAEDDYKTDLPEDKPEDSYQLDKNEPIQYTEEIRDRISMLYVGAYTGMKEFKKVLEYAKKIKNSRNAQVAHVGHYLEAKTLADLGDDNTEKIYEDVIEYYRRAAIKDPSDITVLTYRVQCYIDLKRYHEATEFCRNLSRTTREPLLKQIRDAQNASEEG